MGRIGPGLTSMAMCSCMLTRGGRPRLTATMPAMGEGTQRSPCGLETGGMQRAKEPEWRGIPEGSEWGLEWQPGPEDKVQDQSRWGRGEVGAMARRGTPVCWQLGRQLLTTL